MTKQELKNTATEIFKDLYDLCLEDKQNHSHCTITNEDGERYSIIVLKGDSTICGLMLSHLPELKEKFGLK
jgi:hypothetical protein